MTVTRKQKSADKIGSITEMVYQYVDLHLKLTQDLHLNLTRLS